MLKCGIARRRSKQQISTEKAEAEAREMAHAEKDDMILHLRHELEEKELKAAEFESAHMCLKNMVESGAAVMDEAGNVCVPNQ